MNKIKKTMAMGVLCAIILAGCKITGFVDTFPWHDNDPTMPPVCEESKKERAHHKKECMCNPEDEDCLCTD